MVLCLLIKVCVLCSVGLPGNQPTVLHQRPWAQRPVSTDCVCFFSCNFSSIPLLPVCISAALFLVIVCFFPTVKVIFWNGLGVTASRGSTALVTIRSASAGLAVGLWWRIHPFCTCPGGFHHNTNTPTRILLSVTSHSSLFFSVVLCYNMPFRAVNVWEHTSAACFFFLSVLFISYF